MQLINADSGHYLKGMKENSIDSIVCDPPYGINLLGKKWDKSLPSSDIWTECLRVLRPGGYILAFSAARLYHHLAVDLEKSGFITHPMLGWIYGSGFPKATDLSRELDKRVDRPLPDDRFRNYLKTAVRRKGLTYSAIERELGLNGMFSHYVGKSQSQYPTPATWKQLKKLLGLGSQYDKIINTNRLAERGEDRNGSQAMLEGIHDKKFTKHVPKTKLAKKWSGYKYGLQCLKPAIEPIYMGQKPLDKNMVENIKRWGVGALNIEECRVKGNTPSKKLYNEDGRHPSNVLHDGIITEPFFYCAKPTSKERGEFNFHPTVKPIKLMIHLTKLVTPYGGVCLDPFLGSGTTAIAAVTNGLDFIGVEKSKEYFNLAKKRIKLFQTTCGFES